MSSWLINSSTSRMLSGGPDTMIELRSLSATSRVLPITTDSAIGRSSGASKVEPVELPPPYPPLPPDPPNPELDPWLREEDDDPLPRELVAFVGRFCDPL